MKKNLFFYLFAVLCTVSLFTSCKDDEEPGGTTGPEALLDNVIGTYQGLLKVSLEGVGDLDPVENQKIYVEKSGENQVKMSLRDFSIMVGEAPVLVGDINVEGIALEGEASNVVLKETSTTMQHELLGQLDITLKGNVSNEKADLDIKVFQTDMNLNIAVSFEGNRISKEIDNTDYAQLAAAWYARTNLTAKGLPAEFELKWPHDGIELAYVSRNKVSIPSFYLSFPPKTVSIAVEQVAVENDAEGNIILKEVQQQLGDEQKGFVDMVLSGVVKDGKITLNIALKSEEYNAEYVFEGEKKLTGNSIESMTFSSEDVVVQPEFDGGKTAVKSTFYVKPGAKLSLVPEFTLSEGATIQYKGEDYKEGTAVDFSEEQTFVVTSQKGSKKTYEISALEWVEPALAHNMDEWELKNETSSEDGKFMEYYEPKGWATSNEGVKWIKAMYPQLYAKEAPYVVTNSNNAARLETVDTKGQPGFGGFIPAVPKVTSGSVFNGVFSVDISNTLKSTRFGEACIKEPKSFSGKYKYAAGEKYYYCADPSKANEVVEDAEKKDSPAMNAVLYEADTYTYDYLDGTNLLTSDKIAAIASVKDAKEQSAYVDFNATFEWKEGKSWDSTKKYKLAIVCSSSKDGDKFSGAPGSVLFVDDLKINF